MKHKQTEILAEIEHIDTFKPENSTEPYLVGSIESDVKLIDGRAAKLRRYLRSINSPLFDLSLIHI